MDISLRYVTHFRYATPVWESHNSLRACPADGDGQALLEYGVEITPNVPAYSLATIGIPVVSYFAARLSSVSGVTPG